MISGTLPLPMPASTAAAVKGPVKGPDTFNAYLSFNENLIFGCIQNYTRVASAAKKLRPLVFDQ